MKPPSERNFGLWFALLFGVTGLWKFTVRPLWLAVAVVFLVLALVAPTALKPLNLLWYRFGLLVGRVMNPVVMAVVYVVAIVPIGLLWKFTGRDPLRLRLNPAAASYWIPREDKPQSMLRQF